MELLAPAGTMSHIRAAIEGGADAVYLGGTSFSARRYADNFTEETMREAVRLCHLYGVSVYVTVNILIGDHEMEELEKYLLFLRSLAVDGLIMQDLGGCRRGPPSGSGNPASCQHADDCVRYGKGPHFFEEAPFYTGCPGPGAVVGGNQQGQPVLRPGDGNFRTWGALRLLLRPMSDEQHDRGKERKQRRLRPAVPSSL